MLTVRASLSKPRVSVPSKPLRALATNMGRATDSAGNLLVVGQGRSSRHACHRYSPCHQGHHQIRFLVVANLKAPALRKPNRGPSPRHSTTLSDEEPVGSP
jgi:hypothetical protein